MEKARFASKTTNFTLTCQYHSDTNAARRNLVVISLAFIVYFFAGGSFTDTTVRLQVINAEFSKPIVLVFIAWTIFFWFLYRYWLTHKGSFSREFNKEFSPWHLKSYLYEYLASKTLGSGDDSDAYFPKAIKWQHGCVVLETEYYVDIERDKNGKITKKDKRTPIPTPTLNINI